jgi:hypothetical protein
VTVGNGREELAPDVAVEESGPAKGERLDIVGRFFVM